MFEFSEMMQKILEILSILDKIYHAVVKEDDNADCTCNDDT